jgi:multiple sugar transport system permease protein
VPWWDYTPKWLGWRSLGMSPDTIATESTVRAEFMGRFLNSTIISLTSSGLAVVLGSLAAYGLSRFSYRFGYMRNSDISFFFLSQLILPPVVLALPFAYLHFRSGNIATHVFMGVLAGISFFLLNNVFGYIGNINNWEPWFAAAAPGMLYSLASLAAFGWLVLRQ